MLVMELPWHIVEWGIMMTKHCPRIKECERRVKRSAQTERRAFLCSDLTEMQRQAGCPFCLKFDFICSRSNQKPVERKKSGILAQGITQRPGFHGCILDSLTTITHFLKQGELEKSEAAAWPRLLLCTSFLF